MTEESLPTVSEAIDNEVNAFWRDPEVMAMLCMDREVIMADRMSAGIRESANMRPRMAHETKDDLLRTPQAAAAALGAPAPAKPEFVNDIKSMESADRKKLFRSAERREFQTFNQVAHYRVRAAYRMVREHCRLKHLVSDDESLVECLGLNPDMEGDPWRQPTMAAPPEGRSVSAGLNVPAWHALKNLQGLPLLPPAVPAKFRDRGQNGRTKGDMSVLDSYCPDDDLSYLQWLDGNTDIAGYLNIQAGSENDSEQGLQGLKGMLEPETARLLWPSRYEIVAFEAELIEETLNKMIEGGIPESNRYLRDEYGFTRRECSVLVKLGKALAQEEMEADLEQDRAIMTLRLEDFISRSKTALNLQQEMHGYKLLTLIKGLNKTKPEDQVSDFIDVIGKIAEKRRTAAMVEDTSEENYIEARKVEAEDLG